jgi:NADPH:quinone reductase-like Zn-dependent oxidoreductase
MKLPCRSRNPARCGSRRMPPRLVGERVLEKLLATGQIRPFVGKVVGFADLPTALDEMDQRLTMGRTVVRIP